MNIGKILFNLTRRGIRRLQGQHINHQVQISRTVEHHGTTYGGFFICPDNLSAHSIVYSIGIGDDVTFDLSLIHKYGMNVYAFDPTPKSIDWVKGQTLPSQFRFLEYGIAGNDGKVTFYPPENSEHISHSIVANPNTVDKGFEVEMRRLATAMSHFGA